MKTKTMLTCLYHLRTYLIHVYRDRVMRKAVFGFSDQVRHKPGCKTTEYGRGLKFRIKEVERLYYMYLCSQNKGLISCLVTAQLICAFAFAYAKIRFSHYAGIHYICYF